MNSNFAFEADAVKQRAVSCHVRAPRGSTYKDWGPSKDWGHKDWGQV